MSHPLNWKPLTTYCCRFSSRVQRTSGPALLRKGHHNLNSAKIYRTSTSDGRKLPAFKFVWSSRAPPKVRFFGWLLLHDRLQCRSNLIKKHMETLKPVPTCYVTAPLRRNSGGYSVGTLPTCRMLLISGKSSGRLTSVLHLRPPMLLAFLEAKKRRGFQERAAEPCSPDGCVQGRLRALAPSLPHQASATGKLLGQFVLYVIAAPFLAFYSL